MRKKTLKLVVAFHTTSEAMAGVPGRLIPLPTEISAGCGLAWCAELSDRERILPVLGSAGVTEEDVYECML